MSDEQRKEHTRTAPLEDDPGGRTHGIADVGAIAVVAGFVGIFAYRFLISMPTVRYVVPILDAVAIALGLWILARHHSRPGRLDFAIAAILLGGVSAYLFVSYLTSPAPGGT